MRRLRRTLLVEERFKQVHAELEHGFLLCAKVQATVVQLQSEEVVVETLAHAAEQLKSRVHIRGHMRVRIDRHQVEHAAYRLYASIR